MKRVVAVLVAVLSALLIFNTNIVFAQKLTSLSWNTSTYYQGDSGSIQATLYNDRGDFQICTKQFYVQFDWQEAQKIVFASDETPCIATGDSHTFNIRFTIPSDLQVGAHSYKVVWVDKGILLGSVTLSSGSLNVHDAYERVYLNTLPSVQQKLNSALNSNYQSPDAKASLNQAQNYYNQAVTLANQGQFQNAVNNLNRASDRLDQAYAAEQNYLAQQRSTSQPGGAGSAGSSTIAIPVEVLGGIVVAVIIVIAVAIVLARRKRASPT